MQLLCIRRRQNAVKGALIICMEVHMGLTSPPIRMHQHEPDPSPPHVDVTNGWPLSVSDKVVDCLVLATVSKRSLPLHVAEYLVNEG